MEFLFATLGAIVVHGCFSMLEMAAVSFNKVRLHYFVSQGNRRAIWLTRLLQNPTLLFGTTLICVNTAMQFGSECSRRFYVAMDLSPDWAPLTQIVIVLLFAELSPMFAARRYPEHVAMLGMPLLYLMSIVLRPIIWLVSGICKVISYFFGGSSDSALAISRDELQKAIESREDTVQEDAELDTISSNIFSLGTKNVRDLMSPLLGVNMLPSIVSVAKMREMVEPEELSFVPIYHQKMENIVAVAYPRDLLHLPAESKVRPHARVPWFITEKSSILSILTQFRRNNQSLAVVLSEVGSAIGVLTLDMIIDEIFGQEDEWNSFGEYLPEKHQIVIERSFPDDTSLGSINLPLHFPQDKGETLEEVMESLLGHEPAIDDSVDLVTFTLTFIEGKRILIKTK